MTFKTTGTRLTGTFTGRVANLEIHCLWEILASGVETALLDFQEVTDFPAVWQLESVARQARPIPPCRLAFLCGNDVAFGSIRMLISLCDLRVEYNVFRQMSHALVWLDIQPAHT